MSANFYCRVSCNGFISSLYGKCIAYNAQEDWSLGEESFLFTVPPPGVEYTFRLVGSSSYFDEHFHKFQKTMENNC